MLGDRVKALREARAWTQEHLADAAGVSLRTIQRLETGAGFASETALAVAAALEVDVRTLLEPGEAAPAPLLWHPIPLAPATVAGLLLALPAMLFVAFNLLRYGAGVPAPALDALDSPWVLLGGPLLALAVLLPALVEAQGERRGGRLTLSAVAIRARAAPLLLAAGALAALACLLAYLVGETMGHLARAAGM